MRRGGPLGVTLAGLLAFATACGGGGAPAGGGGSPLLPPVVTPLTITTSSLPDGVQAAGYSQIFTAAGGSGTRTWTVTQGTLPAGLQLSTGGQLSGTPQVAGTHNFTVEVRDSSSPPLTASREFTLRVAVPLQIDTTPLPVGVLNEAYNSTLQAQGGIAPLQWSLSPGAVLPAGLSLNANGGITGTPTIHGQFSVSVRVEDSGSPAQASTRTLSVNIAQERLVVTTTSPLPGGTQGVPYSVTFTATGGTGTLIWESGAGFSPGGLTFSSGGVLSGTPFNHGDFWITAGARDSLGQVAGGIFHYTIAPGSVALVTSTLPPGLVDKFYEASLLAVGGSQPYSFVVSSGALPPGMALEGNTVRGTPTAAGTFTFTVEVTDSSSPPGSHSVQYALEVLPSLGRNDSIANATPLSNGAHRASISPYAHPADVRNPDRDYYRLTAAAGSTVTVETFARRQRPGAPDDPALGPRNLLDTIIEIVDGNGQRYQTCRDPGNVNPPAGFPVPPDPTPDAFDDACMNDDIVLGTINDSRLEFRVPGAAGATVTFYVHVFDWSGMARPDMVYDLVISGVN